MNINMAFDYSIDFKTINFREHPELYRIGKGEQGVLLVEPYKSEILPYWRFKTPDIARQSSEQIYELFIIYLSQEDFIGADMARKFLQMGYTAHADMPIIKVAENIKAILKNLAHQKLKLKKENRFYPMKKI